MLKIYGMMLCPDCVNCVEQLREHRVAFEFYDFSTDLPALKEFLKLRDTMDIFRQVREEGRIGIPCIVDGERVLLNWEEYVSQAGA